jgi:Na+/proline symporter
VPILQYAFQFSGLALLVAAAVGCFWTKKAALATVPAFVLVVCGNYDRLNTFKAPLPYSTIEGKLTEINRTHKYGECKPRAT